MKKLLNRARDRLARQDGGLFLSVMGGVRWTVLFRISGAGFGYLIAVLSARLLTVEDFGSLQYVLGVLNVVFILGGLGLVKLIIRETAVGALDNSWNSARGLMTFAMAAGVLSTLLVGIAGYVLAIRTAHPDLLWVYGLGLLLFVLRQLLLPLTAFMNGLRRIRSAHLGDFLRDFLIVAVLAGLWLTIEQGTIGEIEVTLVRIGATAISLGVLFVLFLRISAALDGDWRNTPRHFAPRSWLGTGLPLMLVAATSVVFHNADVMMLGLMRGTEEVALYYAASRSQGLIEAALAVTLMPLAPVISSRFHQGDLSGLRAVIRKTTLVSVSIALPMSIGLVVFAAAFLALFGEAFRAAEWAMQVLVIATMLTILLGPAEHVLIMTRYQVQAALLALFAAALNVGLNWLLIPEYGLNGAALATAVSTVLLKGLLWAFVHYRVWSRIDRDAGGT